MEPRLLLAAVLSLMILVIIVGGLALLTRDWRKERRAVKRVRARRRREALARGG